jgi:hypothetical protein
VMAPPTPNRASASCTATLRMRMLRSQAPLSDSQPSEPE